MATTGGPAAPTMTKQRMGLGIIKINIEEETENEPRPTNSAEAKAAKPEELASQTQTARPPGESSAMLIELPMERVDAITGSGEALPTGLLHPEAVDVTLKGSMGPAPVTPAQLQGFIEQNPREGQSQPQTLRENVEGMGVQGQHELIHIFQSHFAPATVG